MNARSILFFGKMQKDLPPKHHSQLHAADLRLAAAKDISITHVAAAARSLDAAVPVRSAEA